jgi:hypothetical protein
MCMSATIYEAHCRWSGSCPLTTSRVFDCLIDCRIAKSGAFQNSVPTAADGVTANEASRRQAIPFYYYNVFCRTRVSTSHSNGEPLTPSDQPCVNEAIAHAIHASGVY